MVVGPRRRDLQGSVLGETCCVQDWTHRRDLRDLHALTNSQLPNA